MNDLTETGSLKNGPPEATELRPSNELIGHEELAARRTAAEPEPVAEVEPEPVAEVAPDIASQNITP